MPFYFNSCKNIKNRIDCQAKVSHYDPEPVCDALFVGREKRFFEPILNEVAIMLHNGVWLRPSVTDDALFLVGYNLSENNFDLEGAAFNNLTLPRNWL